MKIYAIKSQNRRDFTAVYECEHCGAKRTAQGYDDANFHINVIPKMECAACGKTADAAYVPQEPKYPEGLVI